MIIKFSEVVGTMPTEETVSLTRDWFWAGDNIALECVPEEYDYTATQIVSKTELMQIDKETLDTLGSVYFYPNPAIHKEQGTMVYDHKLVRVNGFWADFRAEDLDTLLEYMPLHPTQIIKHPTGYSFLWRLSMALPKAYKPLEEYWLRALATVPDRPFNIGTPAVLPLPGTGGAKLVKADANGYTYEEFMEVMDYPDVEVKPPHEHMPY